ncbi:SDR family NAD(P)-dependent oxidoreductase [Mycobacteroides franklinii]|uniref:SDR family NAD(P)-dependent oxidoreductase n=1 Tax=Mycobacteroides franklinii TaxID=948102 RepID=UPI0019D4FA78
MYSMIGKPNRDVAIDLPSIGQLDLSSKRLAVVGGTDGLGRAIAQLALDRGATVAVVGRTFREEPSARIRFVKSDLASMRGAVELGQNLEVEPYDVVLFTNGIFAAKTREDTAEKIERDMAISYLSRYAMLRGLHFRLGVKRANATTQPRVFVMGAPGTGLLGNPDDLNSDRDYAGMSAHMNTVAANEALVVEGSYWFPGPAYFGLNPGVIKTGIRSNYLGDGSWMHRLTETLISSFAPTPAQYAERIVPLLFAQGLDGLTGVMFNSKAQPILASRGMDSSHAGLFMEASDRLLGRALHLSGDSASS